MQVIISNTITLIDPPNVVLQTLTDKLTLKNPKWVENERMGRWNKTTPPTLTFYQTEGDKNLVIPRGFARQLILMLRHHQVPYTIEDRRRRLPEIDFTFAAQLKPFQQHAVDAMLSKDFGTLNAPTGSGKTVMALYMIARRKQPATIIVHNKSLAFQWISRIETFLGIPEKEIGLIGAGRKKIGDRVTVGLVQSMVKYHQDVSRHTGYVIVDECHRTPSRTFTQAVSAFDAAYMLGLSATPFRRDNLSDLIFWYLGDAYHTVNTPQLVQNGDILTAEVTIRETRFVPHADPVQNYAKMLSELTENDERNRMIASDIHEEAKNESGTILVLTDRKKHCDALASLLQYKYKLKVAILTGDLTAARRSAVVDRLNSGALNVLVATGQLIGEGFDAANLTALFLTTPIKFDGRILQYLGRVLRPSADKIHARVFDYVDIRVNVLAHAGEARKQLYYRHGLAFRQPNTE